MEDTCRRLRDHARGYPTLRSHNFPDILRLAPGVEVAQVDSDHWSVSIRGFGAELANKLLVLIDGRSVYTPLYAGVYWQVQATPLEDIDRIEVIRGPGGTIWGANAVDGIINIITRNAKDTQEAMLSGEAAMLTRVPASSATGAGTAAVSAIASTAWASPSVLSFIPAERTSMIGEWGRPDSAPTPPRALGIPSPFKATSITRLPAKRPPIPCILHPPRLRWMGTPTERRESAGSLEAGAERPVGRPDPGLL